MVHRGVAGSTAMRHRKDDAEDALALRAEHLRAIAGDFDDQIRLETDMATLIGTLVIHVRRKWRSRLTAGARSWAASALIRSTAAPSQADDGRDQEWQCARAPAFVRFFHRTRRSFDRSSMRSLFGAGLTFIAALGGVAVDARATTISVRATMSQLKFICSKIGGEHIFGPDGYSCITYNCDGKSGHCSVICNSDGLCTGAMPPAPPRRSR
jgi:hypothetical protein